MYVGKLGIKRLAIYVATGRLRDTVRLVFDSVSDSVDGQWLIKWRGGRMRGGGGGRGSDPRSEPVLFHVVSKTHMPTLNMPGALVYHEREARGSSAGKYMHHNESQFGGGSGLKPDADDLM